MDDSIHVQVQVIKLRYLIFFHNLKNKTLIKKKKNVGLPNQNFGTKREKIFFFEIYHFGYLTPTQRFKDFKKKSSVGLKQLW